MRRSVLNTFAAIAILALTISDGNEKEGPENEPVIAEAMSELKVIEDELVPLTAGISEDDVVDTKEPEGEKKEPEEGEEINKEMPESPEQQEAVEQSDATPKPIVSEEVEEVFGANDLGNGVFGYYSDVSASELISKVNEIRGSTMLLASTELDKVARDRALTCVKDFGHDGMQTFGECLAKGQGDANTVVVSWNASDYHRKLMCDPAYTQVGAACLWYDGGNGSMQSIWVLVLN